MEGLGPDEAWYPSDPDKYLLGQVIGRGSFGTVHKAVYSEKKEVVAVKVVQVELRDMSAAWNEVRTMSGLRHKNILRHLASFGVSDDLWIVLPYYETGSLNEVFKYGFSTGIKSNHLIATILKSVVEAVVYIHKNQIAHKDLKAENILIGSDGRVGISDFGTACDTGLVNDEENMRFQGTVHHMAPEIVRGSSLSLKHNTNLALNNVKSDSNLVKMPSYNNSQTMPEDDIRSSKSSNRGGSRSRRAASVSFASDRKARRSRESGSMGLYKYDARVADMWSLGITSLQLAYAKAPYAGVETIAVTKRILRDPPPTTKTFADDSYKFARSFDDFVRKILVKNPQERPKAFQMKNHKFIRKYSRDATYVRNHLCLVVEREKAASLLRRKTSGSTN
ncbi:hypothetical protein AAMO2058_000258000 [Amorphochlora amoebiformis]